MKRRRSNRVQLVALGTVQLGLSYWLYTRAIRHVTALEAVLIPIIEPLLNPLWVLLFMGETPSGLALLGGAVVIAESMARPRNGPKRTSTRPASVPSTTAPVAVIAAIFTDSIAASRIWLFSKK